MIDKILSDLRNETNGSAIDMLASRIKGMSQEEIDLTVQKLGGSEEAVKKVLEEKINQMARRERMGHEPHKPINKLFAYGLSDSTVHLHLPVQLENIKGKGITGKINTANRYLIDAMDRVLNMKDSGDPRFRNVDSIYMISPILMGKELEVLRGLDFETDFFDYRHPETITQKEEAGFGKRLFPDAKGVGRAKISLDKFIATVNLVEIDLLGKIYKQYKLNNHLFFLLFYFLLIRIDQVNKFSIVLLKHPYILLWVSSKAS